MKHLYAFLLLFCISGSLRAQTVYPGLSPLTRTYLAQTARTGQADVLPDGYVYKRTSDGQVCVSALVRVKDAGRAVSQIGAAGGHVGTRAGDIWTVQIPAGAVRAFTRMDALAYIQLDEPVFPMMDVVRRVTRADSVHKGYNLPMPFNGKDVVMGVLDFGFDYNHPVFFDTTGTEYRVRKVWELNTAGTPPAGYSYGHELVGTAAILAQGTDNSHQTHGTAVAGAAAGSGYGSAADSNRFLGVAYGSEMVFACVRRDSIGDQWMHGGFSDFVDGIKYVFDYATSVQKPAVVNISWGSQSGAHNGTSLFNQACDNLSGPGRIIVMAAGNDGQDRIHLSKTFSATDTALRTVLNFNYFSGAPDTNFKRTWVDIWGDTGKKFCAQIQLLNGAEGQQTQVICTDDQLTDVVLIGSNGQDTCYVQFIPTDAEYNDMPRIIVSIDNKTKDSVMVKVSGRDGGVHMWNEYYFYGYKYRYNSTFVGSIRPGVVMGNTASTVSDMGSARSVVLVGAYASKIAWKDINGNNRGYQGYVMAGSFAPFTSRGPLTDGRVKPDISAPGLTLGTGVSSYDTSYTPTGSSSASVVSEYVTPGSGKKYYYAEFIGTSLASPVAAGVVAMMLQANPALGPDEVLQILKETAIRDLNTGIIPAGGSNIWGAGKINAYASVKRAIQKTDVYTFSGNKVDCALYPNPNRGSFTLDYSGTRQETLLVEVLNMSGSLTAKSTWPVAAGINRRQLSLEHLPKGMYLVRVTGGGGSVAIKTVVE